MNKSTWSGYNLSVHTMNILRNAGIETKEDLEGWTEEKLLTLRGFGRNAAREIRTLRRILFLESKAVIYDALFAKPKEPERILKYQCPSCGAWHKNPRYKEHCIADELPPYEIGEADEGSCPGACSFLHTDDQSEYCVMGLAVEMRTKDQCKFGPECPINRG